MSGVRKLYPAGSTGPLRADVLRALGVLKVVTADQVQRLALPHLSFRYTHLPESKRKSARNKSHRNAAGDLVTHRQVVEAGFTEGGDKLWQLTSAGLEAAARVLDRPEDEMGGRARGAGTTGAAHAMAVNETIIALTQPKPDLAKLAKEHEDVLAAARSVPAGVGSITSWSTEVSLPPTGSWYASGEGGAQADAVLIASEAGVPLLFVEVDNCRMDPERIAAKFDKCMRFFRRMVKDTGGRERSMWRARWSYPEPGYGEVPHPPILLVFNKAGTRNPMTSMKETAEHCRRHWVGEWHGDHHTYDDQIPIVATTLDLLREHGPTGTVFWRFARPGLQSLTDAIGNPRRDAAQDRHRAESDKRAAAYRAEQQRLAEQKEQQREAKRPVCLGCAAKFTDERWLHVSEMAWYQGAQTHPHLCQDCKSHALEGRAPEPQPTNSSARRRPKPRKRPAAGSPASDPDRLTATHDDIAVAHCFRAELFSGPDMTSPLGALPSRSRPAVLEADGVPGKAFAKTLTL
ncbi:replication-relaxation family protein [Streptomyces sp. NPDC020096]